MFSWNLLLRIWLKAWYNTCQFGLLNNNESDHLQLVERVILSERAVEKRQLAQLLPPQLILAARLRDRLVHDLAHLCARVLHNVVRGARDKGVQQLVLARQRLSILVADFALLDGASAPYDDLGVGVLLEQLECGASGADKQAHEVYFRVIILRYEHLVDHLFVLKRLLNKTIKF